MTDEHNTTNTTELPTQGERRMILCSVYLASAGVLLQQGLDEISAALREMLPPETREKMASFLDKQVATLGLDTLPDLFLKGEVVAG